jgi:hypothetical protein
VETVDGVENSGRNNSLLARAKNSKKHRNVTAKEISADIAPTYAKAQGTKRNISS